VNRKNGFSLGKLWMPLINAVKDQGKTHEEGKRTLTPFAGKLVVVCVNSWLLTYIGYNSHSPQSSGFQSNPFSLGPVHDHV
jgi:hypothetical protein